MYLNSGFIYDVKYKTKILFQPDPIDAVEFKPITIYQIA
jgi:hypothetical protein